MALNKILIETCTEEELKFAFAKFFRIKLSTKNFIDLYTPQILFEFKLEASLKNIQIRAACIAQTLYYIRRLKFGSDSRSPSKNICIVTKNSAIFLPTKIFSRYYKGNFDWDLAPSSPCKKLVADLADSEIIREAHVYDFSDSEDEKIFIELIRRTLIWEKMFGSAVENGRKSSEYFITDIEDGKTTLLERSVIFRMSSGELIEKFLDINEYKHDRMSEINMRRFTGEFFTPIEFANKAVEYLTRTIGNFCNGEYRIWDMAAGTGNLEFALPAEALKYCYISTLLEDDADYCRKIFSEATVFQYDYLNDDVEFFGNELVLENIGVKKKMPAKLFADLKNPDLKWIIFINPPYAMASNFEFNNERKDKFSVSMTEIRKLMFAEKLGNTSQELFLQFIYRISKEFSKHTTFLGIFSTLRYIISGSDQEFRDKVFRYKYERGFMFNSKNFEGCKGNFPVGFMIWNLSEHISIEKQRISLDIYNSAVEKVGEKFFKTARREEFLNKWISRPRRVKKYPPMVSGLKIDYTDNVRCDMVAENFLAGFMCKSNDFQNQGGTAFLSGSYSGGNEISVTPENFEQAMIMHMVRRLPKVTWFNNKDQFMQPNKELTPEFISDAVIWSLFSPSNQTVSLRNVEYEGEIYRMRNNFFPFTLEEIKSWKCSSADIRMQIEMSKNDRFAAIWLKNHELSAQAIDVLNSARELYKKFYAELVSLDVKKFKIEDWDVGYYQVRMSLGETVNLENLSKKLLPQIYELGFLRDKVRYF